MAILNTNFHPTATLRNQPIRERPGMVIFRAVGDKAENFKRIDDGDINWNAPLTKATASKFDVKTKTYAELGEEVIAIDGISKTETAGWQAYVVLIDGNGKIVSIGLPAESYSDGNVYFENATSITAKGLYERYAKEGYTLAIMWRLDSDRNNDFDIGDRSVVQTFPERKDSFNKPQPEKVCISCGAGIDKKRDDEQGQAILYKGEWDDQIGASKLVAERVAEEIGERFKFKFANEGDTLAVIQNYVFDVPSPQDLTVALRKLMEIEQKSGHDGTDFDAGNSPGFLGPITEAQEKTKAPDNYPPDSGHGFMHHPPDRITPETARLEDTKPAAQLEESMNCQVGQISRQGDVSMIMRLLMNPVERKLWGKLYGLPDEDDARMQHTSQDSTYSHAGNKEKRHREEKYEKRPEQKNKNANKQRKQPQKVIVEPPNNNAKKAGKYGDDAHAPRTLYFPNTTKQRNLKIERLDEKGGKKAGRPDSLAEVLAKLRKQAKRKKSRKGNEDEKPATGKHARKNTGKLRRKERKPESNRKHAKTRWPEVNAKKIGKNTIRRTERERKMSGKQKEQIKKNGKTTRNFRKISWHWKFDRIYNTINRTRSATGAAKTTSKTRGKKAFDHAHRPKTGWNRKHDNKRKEIAKEEGKPRRKEMGMDFASPFQVARTERGSTGMNKDYRTLWLIGSKRKKGKNLKRKRE